MRAGSRVPWGMFALVFAFSIFAFATGANAQNQDQSVQFLNQTKETAKHGWGLLSMIGSVVIGGGAIISLAAGMYRGQWGQAAISFVAGAAGLLSIWGVGQALGF